MEVIEGDPKCKLYELLYSGEWQSFSGRHDPLLARAYYNVLLVAASGAIMVGRWVSKPSPQESRLLPAPLHS